MGTFHSNMGDLHGITVVVDTNGPELFIGRYFEEKNGIVIMNDVGAYQEEDAATKEEFIKNSSKFGIKITHKNINIELDKVSSIKRLSEVLANL